VRSLLPLEVRCVLRLLCLQLSSGQLPLALQLLPCLPGGQLLLLLPVLQLPRRLQLPEVLQPQHLEVVLPHRPRGRCRRNGGWGGGNRKRRYARGGGWGCYGSR